FPAVNGTVYAAVPDGTGGFYLGGSFSTVGAVERAGLAHVEADGTVDPSFTVATDTGSIRALALSPNGHTLYVGGAFNTLGGVAAPNIGAIDLTGNTATAIPGFAPNSNGTVYALALSSDGSELYVGGNFSFIASVGRSDLVALNASTGAAASNWQPQPSGAVRALALSSDDSTLYVGGDFATIGGGTRTRIAAISANTASIGGTVNAMGAGGSGANDSVEALALSADGSTLWVGGAFTGIGGYSHSR